MGLFMGIDAGTSGIKAIVLDDSGNVLGTGFEECSLISQKPNWAEQNPEDWWDACCSAVKTAALSSGRSDEIISIGLSGQMQGSVLMDKAMKPLGKCMIWLDQRASAEAEELSGVLDRAVMLDIAGNFCMPSNWAPKLLWLKRNTPEIFENISTVLFPKDYLRYMMTGEIATEVSDASATFLLDLKKRNWSDVLINEAGLPREILPSRMLESCDVAGYLQSHIAEQWGLKNGIPVVAGGGDQPVGAIGCGAVQSGVIAVSIGTSGVVFGVCDTPILIAKRRAIHNLCHSVPGKYCFLGCTLGAGGSLKWLRDTIFEKERDELNSKRQDVYDYMSSLASKVFPGSEGLCFLPYLNGESTPHIDANARGVFFGLSYRHDRKSLCRSVMEGVTFSLRDTIEVLRENTQIDISEVRASGGGSKSDLWRQIQADVFNAAVITMNIEEGPAGGAAILAAVGSGHFDSVEEACDAIIKTHSTIEPIQKNVRIYDEYYETYRGLYSSLKHAFKSQAEITNKYLAQTH